MKLLLFKLDIQRFAEDNTDDSHQEPENPNIQLLLDKIKGLEQKIVEQEQKIAAVTDFNRRLLDGSKPAEDTNNKKSKFDAYMNE